MPHSTAETTAAGIRPAAAGAAPAPAEFETGQVITVSGGHFVHDTYSAFLSPLLPLLIEKLGLTLTLAGSLTSFLQIGGVLTPFLGYAADRGNMRYMVILAPAVTATLMSMVGLMPGYVPLAALLLVTGVSISAFHAPAPAMVARTSGKQVGRGMSYFMAGGELGRTLGPLLAVWAVSLWGLEGMWRVSAIGWGTSLILWWRLRNVTAQAKEWPGLGAMFPTAWRVLGPLSGVLLFRGLGLAAMSVYLPTYMEQGGSSLWVAGAALAIFELAGVAGALASGPLSDRLGRRPVLIVALTASALLMLAFVAAQGWLLVPVLLALGAAMLSTQPVMLATVQDHLPEHRSVANGIFIAVTFVVATIAALTVGALGDRYGLRTAFLVSGASILLAVPAVLALPGRVPDSAR